MQKWIGFANPTQSWLWHYVLQQLLICLFF